MGISSWGGGIVLGLVAVLWLVYLIPSWHKRQEYLATERNAVRLQQTLRILAQTAELPEEIRVEANAKSVASAQKILRSEETKREAIRRAQEAARQRAITRELAATAPALRAADAEPALAARRLRRTRLAATLVFVLALVGFVVGVSHLPGAWLLSVASVVAGVGSVVILTQLAAVSRARARRLLVAPVAAAPLVAQPFQDFAPRSVAAADLDEAQDPAAAVAETASRQWTPVAMPRPLYLRRGSARALARSSAVAGSPTTSEDADALRAAAERSAEALRRSQQEAALQDAQREALREVARAEAALQAQRAAVASASSSDLNVAPLRRVPAAEVATAEATVAAAPVVAAPASPFARMGYIDEAETQDLRLDEVLQRRRAV